MFVGVVSDHELEQILFKARVEARKRVNLAIEANESKQMFCWVIEAQIMQIFNVSFALFEDVHLNVDKIPKMQMLTHDVDDAVDDGEMIVGLFVLDPPDRGHFFILFCVCGYLFSEINFCLYLLSSVLEVSQILYYIHMSYLIVNFISIVQAIGFKGLSFFS